MTDTAPIRQALHERGLQRHGLAEARVRSLAARPVGPMKVRRAQEHPIRHQ